MLNTSAATARLAREIAESERQIAQALVGATAVLHSCSLAARDNKATTAKVQAAFLRAQKTTASLIQAQAEVARTHSALLDIYREVAGTEEPYPCPEKFTSAEVDDKIAAA